MHSESSSPTQPRLPPASTPPSATVETGGKNAFLCSLFFAWSICLSGEESALLLLPPSLPLPPRRPAAQSASRRSDSLRRFCSSLGDSYVKSAAPTGACFNDGAHVLSPLYSVVKTLLHYPLPPFAGSTPIHSLEVALVATVVACLLVLKVQSSKLALSLLVRTLSQPTTNEARMQRARWVHHDCMRHTRIHRARQ